MSGKRVLVRVDFNVPMKNRRISEDLKIRESLPTIKYLIAKNAKVILMSHLGRPEGKRIAALSLSPIAKHLEELLHLPVKFIKEVYGKAVDLAVENMQPGEVVLLENVRFSPYESGKDMNVLAKALVEKADFFVQECFF